MRLFEAVTVVITFGELRVPFFLFAFLIPSDTSDLERARVARFLQKRCCSWAKLWLIFRLLKQHGLEETPDSALLQCTDVYLFVMAVASLTTSALTGQPMTTKEKKMYANLPSCSSAVPLGRGRAQRAALWAKFISFKVHFQVAACANK